MIPLSTDFLPCLYFHHQDDWEYWGGGKQKVRWDHLSLSAQFPATTCGFIHRINTKVHKLLPPPSTIMQHHQSIWDSKRAWVRSFSCLWCSTFNPINHSQSQFLRSFTYFLLSLGSISAGYKQASLHRPRALLQNWSWETGPRALVSLPKLCCEAAVIPPSGPLLEAKINSALWSVFFFFFLFGTQFWNLWNGRILKS